MKQLDKIFEQTGDILKELEKTFFDIPFENSDFQNKVFVIAAQETPARAYRAIGLKMFSKIQAIKELKFTRQLEEVDIDEKQAIINKLDSSVFDKRRAQIEIDRILSARGYADKLLNDAIHELNFLYSELKKFPQYTREQFELEEYQHFEKKLTLQIETHGNGSLQSLAAMKIISEFDRLIAETMKTLENQ